MLPIPGTGSVEHLEENVARGRARAQHDEIARLDHAVPAA